MFVKKMKDKKNILHKLANSAFFPIIFFARLCSNLYFCNV